MTILIFGISGQDGFYLKRLCESKGYHVIGVARSAGDWIQGSVADREIVYTLVKKHQPFCVFHLAANSSTRHGYVYENNDTICNGSLHILEAVYLHSKKSKVFLSGSGLQFVNKGQPIKETDEFFAGSPYATQRIYTTYLARYYRTLGVEAYVGYFFNHDSPLRSEQHVNQKIVRAAQRIAAGSDEKLELGNIEVEKEFGFAGDIMEAVWLLVNQDVVFEAVIGTGNTFSIKDWVVSCFNHVAKNWEQHLVVRADYVPEYRRLVSNPALIKKLGWNPKTDFQELTHLMMSNI